MKRNCLVALFAFVLWALAPAAFGQHHHQGMDHGPIGSMASCAQNCKDCQKKCEDTLAYCQKQKGAHQSDEHLKALQDCIQTCKQSQDFINRGSAMASATCSTCAQACKRCAESCLTFKDDKVMQACAEECRKCETSCISMARAK
jgi:hypothetical protein